MSKCDQERLTTLFISFITDIECRCGRNKKGMQTDQTSKQLLALLRAPDEFEENAKLQTNLLTCFQ
jgi:hypothetical protein